MLARRTKALSVLLALTATLSVFAWLRPLGASDPDVGLINAERIHRGIPALKEDSGLDSCAAAHSRAMAERQNIWHNLNQTAYRCAGAWTAYGENVGMGPSVQAVHDAFMNSPEHRSNILCRCFNLVGAGESWHSGVVYVTEIYVYRAKVIRRSSKATQRPVEPRSTPTPPTRRRKPHPALHGAPVTVAMLLRMLQFS